MRETMRSLSAPPDVKMLAHSKGKAKNEPRDGAATGVESADCDALGFLCWPTAGPVGRPAAASTLASRGWISCTAIAFASIRLLHGGVASSFHPTRRSLSSPAKRENQPKYYFTHT